jgi:hypothetical protein
MKAVEQVWLWRVSREAREEYRQALQTGTVHETPHRDLLHAVAKPQGQEFDLAEITRVLAKLGGSGAGALTGLFGALRGAVQDYAGICRELVTTGMGSEVASLTLTRSDPHSVGVEDGSGSGLLSHVGALLAKRCLQGAGPHQYVVGLERWCAVLTSLQRWLSNRRSPPSLSPSRSLEVDWVCGNPHG